MPAKENKQEPKPQTGEENQGEPKSSPEEKKYANPSPPRWWEKRFRPLKNISPPVDLPDVHYWTLAVHRFILAIAFVTLIVAVVTAIYGILLYKHEQDKDREEQEKNREEIKAISERAQFVITSPMNGDSVSCRDSIEGFSPYSKMNHYLIVIPSGYPDEWIQDDRMRTSAAGKWKGVAQFGEDNLGPGQLYYVRCIATDQLLKPGKLITIPPDAIISNEIKVYRKFDDCP